VRDRCDTLTLGSGNCFRCDTCDTTLRKLFSNLRRSVTHVTGVRHIINAMCHTLNPYIYYTTPYYDTSDSCIQTYAYTGYAITIYILLHEIQFSPLKCHMRHARDKPCVHLWLQYEPFCHTKCPFCHSAILFPARANHNTAGHWDWRSIQTQQETKNAEV
jgi:hypothetical protein